MRGNVAEEAQGIRFPTAFMAGTEIFKSTGGERARLLQVAGAQTRLAQRGEQQWLDTPSAARGGLLLHAFEQSHRLLNTSAQHICFA